MTTRSSADRTANSRLQSSRSNGAIPTLVVTMAACALLLFGGLIAQLPAQPSTASQPPRANDRLAVPSNDIMPDASIDLARILLDEREAIAPDLVIGRPARPTSAPLRIGDSVWAAADLRPSYPEFLLMERPDDSRSTRALALFRAKTAVEDLLARRAADEGKLEDAELRRLIELRTNQIVSQYYLRRHVLDSITVSASEIEEFAEANPDWLIIEPTASIALIVTETAEEAAEARRRLSEGIAFETVAGELSIHSSRQRGGTLPPSAHGTYDPKLEEIAWEQPIGTTSAPTEIGGRHYIIRTIARTDAVDRPLEEVRAEIFAELYEAKRRDAYHQLVRELAADQAIYLFDDEYQEPAAGEETPAAAGAPAESSTP